MPGEPYPSHEQMALDVAEAKLVKIERIVAEIEAPPENPHLVKDYREAIWRIQDVLRGRR